MAEIDTAQEDAAPKKSRKLLVVVGLVLLVAGGAGGFYATYTGLLAGAATKTVHAGEPPAIPDIAFVPLQPLVISLAPGSRSQHLKFSANLEVAKAHEAEVTLLTPRVLDVLNGYLRAVEVSQLENPASLVTLRAQMLRRIQIVTGPERVRDLLVTEFVLN